MYAQDYGIQIKSLSTGRGSSELIATARTLPNGQTLFLSSRCPLISVTQASSLIKQVHHDYLLCLDSKDIDTVGSTSSFIYIVASGGFWGFSLAKAPQVGWGILALRPCFYQLQVSYLRAVCTIRISDRFYSPLLFNLCPVMHNVSAFKTKLLKRLLTLRMQCSVTLESAEKVAVQSMNLKQCLAVCIAFRVKTLVFKSRSDQY